MIPTSGRIFVCNEPQDMRRSFDTLALVVKESMVKDPQCGALFVTILAPLSAARAQPTRRPTTRL